MGRYWRAISAIVMHSASRTANPRVSALPRVRSESSRSRDRQSGRSGGTAAPARSCGSPTTFHARRSPWRTARRVGTPCSRCPGRSSGRGRVPVTAAASAWTAPTSRGSAGTPARAVATVPSTSGAVALRIPASSESSRLRPAVRLRERMTRS